MLLQIKCQDCGKDMLLVQDDEVEKRIATGEYVNGSKLVKRKKFDGEQYTTPEEGIFGICSKCAADARAIIDNSGADAAVTAQTRRIQDRLALIRERRPDLTLEQAARAAVESEFDPNNEPNVAFRAYLLEHAAKDEANDAAARGFLADLDGPNAGGAA